MNKESFLETLKTKYSEEIHSAYQKHEHRHDLDILALNKQLNQIMKTAKLDGLPQRDFEDLVKSVLPESVVSLVDLKNTQVPSKKAA